MVSARGGGDAGGRRERGQLLLLRHAGRTRGDVQKGASSEGRGLGLEGRGLGLEGRGLGLEGRGEGRESADMLQRMALEQPAPCSCLPSHPIHPCHVMSPFSLSIHSQSIPRSTFP